jgi:hypothetical protein
LNRLFIIFYLINYAINMPLKSSIKINRRKPQDAGGSGRINKSDTFKGGKNFRNYLIRGKKVLDDKYC